MKTRRTARWITVMLVVVFCITAAAPAFAVGRESTQTIRVGCVDIDSFLTISNGSAIGYGADYLREISGYTGWTYEYVSGTWNQCLQWLRDGEIDLLLPAEYSEERAEDFLFSAMECCIDYVVLLALADSGLYYEDYESYNGITVGMIEGNYLNDCFFRYASENGFTSRPVYFDTGAELSYALENRDVDAVVTGNMDIDADTKIVAKFDYMPAYFITGKANAALMDALDDAMYRINLENPYFTASLYEAYYAPFVSQSKVLTREESEYIETAQPLRVVCDSDNYPFEWYDAATQSYRGIDVDILNLISENSGLVFEFIYTDSLLESWNMMRSGEADIIAGVYLNERLSAAYRMEPSASYITETGTAICRRGEPMTISDIHTVALRESFVGTAEYLRAYYPNWAIVTYTDADECLRAVAAGEADITFLGAYRLQTEAVLDDYPQLSVLPSVSIGVPMMLGISESAPELLRAVLNKSIHTITQAEKQQIVADNTVALSYHISFGALLLEHPVAAISTLLAVILMISLLVFLVVHARWQKKYAASLNEKNRELALSNHAINAFFSQLSHDMRTPMNAVLSFSQFGLESASVNEATEYFRKIRNSGQYLLSLINDTLDISKIDAGKVELRPEATALSELTAAIEAVLRVTAEKSGVYLTITDETPAGSAALLDKTHIEQVLVNLLNNAIKFTPSGGAASLRISRDGTDEKRPAVCFAVSDTGIGMSPAFIAEKLYRPFEQENRDESSAEAGTGLGLAVVKKLVDLMGGAVSCESELGRGTAFTVTVPTVFSIVPGAAPLPQPEDHSVLEGRHILLCEDHPINREIIVKLLKKEKMTVDAAVDGKEGLEMFARSKPGTYDAVLMDLRMPVMDGIEATCAIRALSRNDAGTVPIIAITANVFEKDIELCAKAGMNAHLAKPVEPQLLYQTLCDSIFKIGGRNE